MLNAEDRSSTLSPVVNVLLFYENEELHSDYLKGFNKAIHYFQKSYVSSSDVKIGEVYKIQSNGTDVTKILEELCNSMEQTFANLTDDKKPDIAVDLTLTGASASAVKILTRYLSLPTVSSSFSNAISEWKKLTENQKRYLIHVAPPADIIPQAIRGIAEIQMLNNVQVLFESEYDLLSKNETLLKHLDFVTKANFSEMQIRHSKLRDQIVSSVDKSFSNYFVMESPFWSCQVLKAITDPELRNGTLASQQFAWHTISMKNEDLKCSCESNISVIHLHPIFTENSTERIDYLSAFMGLSRKPTLTELFQFDLTTNAINAVANLKLEGNWTTPTQLACNLNSEFSDDYNLDFISAFNTPEIYERNLLGQFHIDPEVGKSFANFEMNISRLQFVSGQEAPQRNVVIGRFKAGFGGQALIEKTKDSENEWNAHKFGNGIVA